MQISRLLEEGTGVVIIQLSNGITHQEAHAREFAIIKALGLQNITNAFNGTAFGNMKTKWNYNEVVNFGTMSLFNALKMCIFDNPYVIYIEDVVVPNIK